MLSHKIIGLTQTNIPSLSRTISLAKNNRNLTGRLITTVSKCETELLLAEYNQTPLNFETITTYIQNSKLLLALYDECKEDLDPKNRKGIYGYAWPVVPHLAKAYIYQKKHYFDRVLESRSLDSQEGLLDLALKSVNYANSTTQHKTREGAPLYHSITGKLHIEREKRRTEKLKEIIGQVQTLKRTEGVPTLYKYLLQEIITARKENPQLLKHLTHFQKSLIPEILTYFKKFDSSLFIAGTLSQTIFNNNDIEDIHLIITTKGQPYLIHTKDILGRGATAITCTGLQIDVYPPKDVAVKVVDKYQIQVQTIREGDFFVKQILREQKHHQLAAETAKSHTVPYIAKAECLELQTSYLVMHQCDTTLHNVIDKLHHSQFISKELRTKFTLRLICPIIEGLITYQKKGLHWGDPKPDNIFMDLDPLHIFIGDLGHSFQESDPNKAKGKLFPDITYLPPESIKIDETQDYKTIVSSMGLILFEIVYNRIFWDQDTPKTETLDLNIFRKIGKHTAQYTTFYEALTHTLPWHITDDRDFSNCLRNFLLLTLNPDPSRRISLREILLHPIFRYISSEKETKQVLGLLRP